jgi:ubiquinone/menaquinone biosynthesis C-methylase UbiE
LSLNNISENTAQQAVNRAFSKQSAGYDEADNSNIILRDLRAQVYGHLEKYLSPSSNILELNAGTGIDAMYLASKGHRVHATDLSDGMVEEIRSKIARNNLSGQLTCQQLSYENLDQVRGKKFDYVFSNFGGLNCIQDLSLVTRHLPSILKPAAYVTWVIMPPVCPLELLWVFKGKWQKAFRRLDKNGTLAHVEGQFFKTYYHSLRNVRSALGPSFKFIRSEGLAALSPQPHSRDFPLKHPKIYRLMRLVDTGVKDSLPFNRWADHIVATFQYGRK